MTQAISLTLTPSQQEFITKHINAFNHDSWQVECAGVAGSSRQFFRIKNHSSSYIMIVWDSKDEDWPRFLGIPKELDGMCTFLPEIYISDSVHGLILEQDLGDLTLKKYIQDRSAKQIELVYRKVLDTLCLWQKFEVAKSSIISSRTMDHETLIWESWYFGKYCVTDFFAGETLLDDNWEQERQKLATEVGSLPRSFIHRDFQSENIMVYNDSIRFIDFQGARLGPREYDVASLLYDPYVEQIDFEMRERLIQYYFSLWSGECTDRKRAITLNGVQRLMQALGAYGNLSLHKGKDWYRGYIPLALERLDLLLATVPDFPNLKSIVSCCRNSLK
ncbi:MAG TPA: phosphotransferase [Chitinispirillaceae bacterium]|nr:phosphotransferase [Chitinispirillaceae bacterium]